MKIPYKMTFQDWMMGMLGLFLFGFGLFLIYHYIVIGEWWGAAVWISLTYFNSCSVQGFYKRWKSSR